MIRGMTREQEVAWAAGLFEGEGCFIFVTSRRDGRVWTYLNVGLGMTDRDVVERFRVIMGVGSISFESRKHATHKDMHNWQVSNRRDVAIAVALLEPFLGERRTARLNEIRGLTSPVRRKACAKTLCSRGHALIGENRKPNGPNGKITCRRCANERTSRKRLTGSVSVC